MTTIDCETERPNEFPQVLHVRAHTFRADVEPDTEVATRLPGRTTTSMPRSPPASR